MIHERNRRPVGAGTAENHSSVGTDKGYNGTGTNSSEAVRTYLGRLPGWRVDELASNRWMEAEYFAIDLGVSAEAVVAEAQKLQRQSRETGFTARMEWHRALLTCAGLSNAEKVAALMVWNFANSSTMYAWPSQARLAQDLGYARGSNVGKVLTKVFEFGALTQVAVKDLPPDVKLLATEGSFRSLRGVAYRLNPVENWRAEAAAYLHRKEAKGSMVEPIQVPWRPTLTSNTTVDRLAPDSSPLRYVDSPDTSQTSSTLEITNEGRKASDVAA